MNEEFSQPSATNPAMTTGCYAEGQLRRFVDLDRSAPEHRKFMQAKLLFFLSLALIGSGGCCCARKPQAPANPLYGIMAQPQTSEVSGPDYEAKPQIVASKTSDVDANLARQMVQIGKQEFKDGELVLAEETFRQATQTDPLNNEAWYYRYQVNKAIRDKHHGPRLWYPTLPPRPAGNEGIP